MNVSTTGTDTFCDGAEYNLPVSSISTLSLLRQEKDRFYILKSIRFWIIWIVPFSKYILNFIVNPHLKTFFT